MQQAADMAGLLRVAEKDVENRFEATRTSVGLTPLVGREKEVDALFQHWYQLL